MSGDLIHARLSAVTKVADQIAGYGRQTASAGDSARRDLTAATNEFARAVQNSHALLNQAQRRLAAAQQALAACREGCGGLAAEVAAAQQAVGRAEQRHRENVAAQAQARAAIEQVAAALSVARAKSDEQSRAARASVLDYAVRLEEALRVELG